MRQHKLNPKRTAILAERAHAMRHAPTESEAALFRLLSARKLGVQFRRQVPVAGRYIADFLAPAARLIVEVDGPCHTTRTATDARRDRRLQKLGYRVLRLEASLVLLQPHLAVHLVQEAIASR